MEKKEKREEEVPCERAPLSKVCIERRVSHRPLRLQIHLFGADEASLIGKSAIRAAEPPLLPLAELRIYYGDRIAANWAQGEALIAVEDGQFMEIPRDLPQELKARQDLLATPLLQPLCKLFPDLDPSKFSNHFLVGSSQGLNRAKLAKEVVSLIRSLNKFGFEVEIEASFPTQ